MARKAVQSKTFRFALRAAQREGKSPLNDSGFSQLSSPCASSLLVDIKIQPIRFDHMTKPEVHRPIRSVHMTYPLEQLPMRPDHMTKPQKNKQ